MRCRNRSVVAVVAVVALFVLGAAACGGGGDAKSAPPTTVATTTTLPAPTTTTLPPNGSRIAQVTVPTLQVYDQPGAPAPSRTFPNPWYVNDDARYPVQQVFLAEALQPGWVQILLPIRPNGSTGWVRSTDVQLAVNTYRVVVQLSLHQITVFNGAAVFYQGPVAIGAPATPTPTGNYFIRVLQQAPDPEHRVRAVRVRAVEPFRRAERLQRRRRRDRHPRQQRRVRARPQRQSRLHPHGQRRDHQPDQGVAAGYTGRRPELTGEGA